MQLTKTITRIDRLNHPITDLKITVDYNAKEREVGRIKSITSYDYHSGVEVDMTIQFAEHFMDALDSMVDSIDWSELAADESEVIELESKSIYYKKVIV